MSVGKVGSSAPSLAEKVGKVGLEAEGRGQKAEGGGAGGWRTEDGGRKREKREQQGKWER